MQVQLLMPYVHAICMFMMNFGLRMCFLFCFFFKELLPSLSAVEFHVDRRSFVPMASFWADYTGRTLPFPPHSLYPSPLLSHSDSLHSSHLSMFHRGDEEGIRLSERKNGEKKPTVASEQGLL